MKLYKTLIINQKGECYLNDINIIYEKIKKITNLVLVVLIIFTLISNVDAIYDYNGDIKAIRAFIYTFDNRVSEVAYIKELKDVNGQYNFCLYSVDDGYAIVSKTNKNIVEISYDNFPSDDTTYYFGPGIFYDAYPISYYSNENEVENNLENIKNTTQSILNEKHISFEYDDNAQVYAIRPYPSMPTSIKGGTEVGAKDGEMDIFNGDKWVSSENRCGAWAAAVMITYMDKYHGGKYFKETGTYSEGKIINRLTQLITGFSNANQVLNAINTIFLKDYPNGGKHGTVATSVSTFKSKIKSKYPVCLLLQGFLNSGYGNHWVCGYKYVDYKGELWFKVHDNWSASEQNKHRGWVMAGWIYKGVYTN